MSNLLIDKRITNELASNAGNIRELKKELEVHQALQEELLMQYRCDHDFVALSSFIVSVDRCKNCGYEWVV